MPAPKGRPTKFTQKIADEICSKLTYGFTLREVCRAKKMPCESTVRAWALDDYKGFYAQYAKSREIGYQYMADELLEIADDGSNDWMKRQNSDGSTGDIILNGEHVQRSRLRLDTRKWMLSKVLPKIYGDKITQEHTGKDGKDLVPEHSNRHIARGILKMLAQSEIDAKQEE